MNKNTIYALIAIAIILVVGAFMILREEDETSAIFEDEETSEVNTPITKVENKKEKEEMPSQKFSPIRAADVKNVNTNFKFSSVIPDGWESEAVPSISAINIYDPKGVGANELEKSQIFVRLFSASDFLTLSTVTILNVRDLVISDASAREYLIVKKPGVPSFPDQPAWRNEEHIVTDVRVSKSNPSVFYVIAKRPDLDDATYQAFLDNLILVDGGVTSLVEPVEEFQERISKKPFGIFVNPENSPVQPERFTGYHTGVDVEFGDVKDKVPILAIADGKVVLSRTASGYGGVVVILHNISDKPYSVLYGHLNPSSMVKNNSVVEAGQVIGVLGRGETAETDGQRKHLHFSVMEGVDLDILGYVQDKKMLAKWINPIELF